MRYHWEMLMSVTKFPLLLAAAALIAAPASAAILIDATTNNGSFELTGGVSGTQKATHWDTDSDGDIDNWTYLSGPAGDSGTDVSAAATEGTRVGFLQGGNAAYNLTSYLVQEGDVFTYSWDWALQGRGPAVAGLAYNDSGVITAIPASDTTNPDNLMPHLGLGATYAVLAGNPAIGKAIALTITAPSGSNYPEVDNFALSVVSVPEPAALALLALSVVGLAVTRR